jgi:calcineurin-like phosphoesterase family protein
MNIVINNKSENIVVFSDLHLGHNKTFVVEKRNFKDVKEHDETIFHQLANIKGIENTIAFNLGDPCIGAGSNEANFKNFDRLASIPFKEHYMIWGNHNSGAQDAYQQVLAEYKTEHNISDPIEIYPLIYKNIIFVGSYFEATIFGEQVVMTHYPFEIWDKSHDESWHLCGHSHGSFPKTLPQYSDGKRLDCGVDVALKNHGLVYWTWQQIHNILKKKPVLKSDRH